MQDILSPQDLAKKTTDDIIKNLKTDSTDDVLGTLRMNYDILNK